MHSQTMQLTGKANRKITDVNHFLHFTIALLQTFAHFIGNQLAK